MKLDNPVNRKLLNLTLLLVLSPLYAVVLFAPYTGVLWNVAGYWSHGTPFAALLFVVFVMATLVSVVWVLRRGTLVGPVTLLLLTLIAGGVTNNVSLGHKSYTLSIGAGRPMLGIDVFCNDVYLGKTPLTLSEAEFNRKVKPWDSPPSQPLMIIDDDHSLDRYAWAKFTYVPQDVFEMKKQWPPDSQRYNRHDSEETLADIKASRYWWRFEKDGCIGLTTPVNFYGGSGGVNGRVTVNIDPSITFLSAEENLDLLLAQLEQDGYVPSQAWLNHVLTYKGLLLVGFYARTERNDIFRSALDALVRAEFAIPQALSESDARRIVDVIVKRAGTRRCFTVPSLDSLAIEMVAQAHAQPVVDRFLELASLPHAGSNGRRSSGVWTTYRRNGPRAQLLPLEHAIKKIAPPQLFERLVYMSRGGAYMDLLGNYPREELVWLFRHYLDTVQRQGGLRRDSRINEALRMCAQIKNPLLEETLRQFVRESAGQGHGSAKHHVRQFVESRINDPAIDQGQLATWIYHWAPLGDRVKLELLPRIQDPNASNYIRNLVMQNQRRREDVLQQISGNPNPGLDQFVIDTYNWYQSPQGPGYWSTAVTYALVRTDTPAVRDLIAEKWNEGSKNRLRMIDHLNSGDWCQANMNWLVPMIAELTAKPERRVAVTLLSRIDTPEAYELAEKWATDSESVVSQAAIEQLEIRDQRAARKQMQLAQADELLTDRIKPDDLLPASTPYTWNGTEYTETK
jgi:hypothetical protein